MACHAARSTSSLSRAATRAGRLRSIDEHASPIDNVANPLGTRPSGLRRADHGSNAVHPGHANWPEALLGEGELLNRDSVPATWQHDVLVQANDPRMFGPSNPEVETMRGARAILHDYELMFRAGRQKW